MDSTMTPADRPTPSVVNNQSKRGSSIAALERHYSVAELAEQWFLSQSTVRRIFINEPGVLKIIRKESRIKRRYTTLRIPERVANKVHSRLRGLA